MRAMRRNCRQISIIMSVLPMVWRSSARMLSSVGLCHGNEFLILAGRSSCSAGVVSRVEHLVSFAGSGCSLGSSPIMPHLMDSLLSDVHRGIPFRKPEQKRHIPSNLVVMSRAFHDGLEISMRYPPCVS